MTYQRIMTYINKCIEYKDEFLLLRFHQMVDKLKIGENQKDQLKSFSVSDLIKLNKNIYNFFDDIKKKQAKNKNLNRFNDIENYNKLCNDYKYLQNSIYTMVSTETYRPKKVTGYRVHVDSLEKIYGDDNRENMNDLFQEMKLYIWEAIRKYGKFPENRKNPDRRVAKLSTFAFMNVIRSLKNLGRKISAEKNNVKFIDLDLTKL